MDLLDDIVPDAIPLHLLTGSPDEYIPNNNDDDDDSDYTPHRKRKPYSKKDTAKREPTISIRSKSVALPRDTLLSIGSADFDAFVAQFGVLSSAEKAQVRKQRRLIKNRESAARHRKRQASALSEVEQLKEENKKLKEENKKLKGL